MGRSLLSTLAISVCLMVAVVVTVNTLNESGAPVDLEVSLRADYRGTTVGSTTLRYHWISGELAQSSESEVIGWRDQTVAASSSISNSIDSKILEYLSEATQSTSWLRVGEDGSWAASFAVLVGGSLPIHLVFSGRDGIVTGVSVTCDAELLPSALKTTLRNLGVTGLDLVVGWNLVISGDFLKDWIANLFQIIREGITTIAETSSRFVCSIELG